MGAAAPGPALQRVPLDEVDEANAGRGARPRTAVQNAARVAGAWSGWHARSPSRAVALLVGALVLVVGLAVATPAAVAAYERSTVLRPAAFDGAIRYAGAEPAVRWTTPVDTAVAPLLAGDTLVVATGTGPHDRSLTGLDVVTGAVRWTVPLGSSPPAQDVRCLLVAERVACTVGAEAGTGRAAVRSRTEPPGPVPAARLLLVDPRTGVVLHRGATPGNVVSVATADGLGGDVVLAAIAHDVLTIRRVEPETGRLRWEARRPSAFPASPTSRVHLQVGGGLVVATAEGSTIVVRAADGTRVPPPSDAVGTDETFLRSDGTLVRTRYRLHTVGVDVVSELSDGSGDPWLTVRGVPVEPAVSDGASGLVFTSSTLAGGPLAGRVRAYLPDRPDAVWHALTPSREIAADVAGRVVLRAAGALVGLDAGSGETVWRRTFGLGMGSVFSDGRLVVVQRTTPDEGAVLLALDLVDGRTRWVADLPHDTRTVVRLGSHLYAMTEDALAALR